MLKFYVDNNKNDFTINFDVPLPKHFIAEPGFQKIYRAFTRQKNRLGFQFNTNQDISGIQGELSDLAHTIKSLFPALNDCNQLQPFHDLTQLDYVPTSGLQVNFHQQTFDSPERYWQFIFNQGNFSDYFLNRLNWYLAPKSAYVTSFPLHVDLESASTCNMNCPMCYRDQIVSTGHMDFGLFIKAVDECAANHVFSIRLSWRGETLTLPEIQKMIAYATAHINNVSFLTNAFYLDDEIIDCLIHYQVSYIAVSFDGIGKIYETVRHPAKFQESYQRLLQLQAKRKSAGSLLPQVRLCTIWPAIKDDPDAYYHKMKTVSDYIVCNPYINFKGPMKIKPDFICQYPWERIVIGYDGQTQCCTGWNADDIILGNVGDQTITEMWHSDLMNSIRNHHASGKRMDLNSCAKCRHGAEGDAEADILEIVNRQF
jgi:radical SAM protein with 4Fe4S-binding SPASM domain